MIYEGPTSPLHAAMKSGLAPVFSPVTSLNTEVKVAIEGLGVIISLTKLLNELQNLLELYHSARLLRFSTTSKQAKWKTFQENCSKGC